jgi:hypothetical protein
VQPEKAMPKERVRALACSAVRRTSSSGCRLEDGQVARDAAALGGLLRRGGGDVVGDGEGTGLDAVARQAFGGLAEVEDVARVVAVHEQDARAAVGGPCHGADLLCRGRGEDVADGGAVREAPADQSGEGRVVAGSAADDDGDLPGGGPGGAYDASGDGSHPAAMGGGEAFEGLVGEGRGVVEEPGHRRASRGLFSAAGAGSAVPPRAASQIIRTADRSMKKPTR